MLDELIQKILDFILGLFGINTKQEENINKSTNNATNNNNITEKKETEI